MGKDEADASERNGSEHDDRSGRTLAPSEWNYDVRAVLACSCGHKSVE